MNSNTIKKMLSINTYSNGLFWNTIGLKNRKLLEKYLEGFKEEDYLYDISSIKDFRHQVDNGTPFFTYDTNWSNNHIYGNSRSVFGCEDDKQAKFIPALEHGLIFYNDVFTDLRATGRAAFATFSDFRKKIIQSRILRPTFCVGPYIHYSGQYYDEEKMKEYKRKYGRTLLVFPSHTTDSGDVVYQNKLFIDKIHQVAKKYSINTIIVNIFWWNINNPIVEEFKNEGFVVTTCGFRDDPMFMKRLKSYISLADMAIGDGVGTHVGYCINCGVPYMYVDVGTESFGYAKDEVKTMDFCEKQIERIKKIYKDSDTIGEKELWAYNKYWGGDKIKTDEEIQCIINITKDITYGSHGFNGKSYEYSRKMYNDSSKPELYIKLLVEAL